MSDNGLFIIAVLFANLAICEWLVKKTVLKHFGTALLIIAVTALVANLGIIPSSTNPPPVYDQIFSVIAPLSIFFLLLECDLAAIRSAGIPILVMFFIGSLGTVIGVLVGAYVCGGAAVIGEFFPQLAGMFTGTYTGGSINFNAVALEYNINQEGNLYTGAVAIDNIWTALWMIATIGLPKLLWTKLPRRKQAIASENAAPSNPEDKEVVNPFHLGILISLGLLALIVSEHLDDLLATLHVNVPSILILTTLSLLLAQLPIIKKLSGSRILGITGIYLFLAVIGAYCDFSTLGTMGHLAVDLFIFVSAVVIVHGLFTFGIGALLKFDWDIVAIASQANVGGSGSALALARSLNREELLLPAILIGTLGNALGTYLAFLMVAYYL